MRETFRFYDQDDSGFVSSTELLSSTTKLLFKMRKVAEEMIKLADVDGDGQLNYEGKSKNFKLILKARFPILEFLLTEFKRVENEFKIFGI